MLLLLSPLSLTLAMMVLVSVTHSVDKLMMILCVARSTVMAPNDNDVDAFTS